MYIHSHPLQETVQALRTGALTLPAYLGKIADRVEAIEPQVHALLPELERWTRLRQEASALEMQHDNPESRPPLYGLLVGVKDIFRVDGFPTHAGSRLPSELFDGPETACVTKVKQAGGLILGKTVTTEFAYFQPGPTRNPHNLNHTPGGSSSGSAAAVAAGYCGLAFGTQTIGSVIRPAAFCGVVGFKPSFDRIPTDGLLYLSPSMDHIGLFTQDVTGMRLAASQLCQDWQAGPATASDASLPVLGVPDGPYLKQALPEGQAAFESQIGRLEEAGATVRRIPALADIDTVNQRHRRIVAAEAARVHKEWFAQYADLYSQAMTTLIEAGQGISDDQLAADLEESQEFRRELQAKMDQEGIDLWVCPSATGPAPRGIESTGDPIMNLPWTHAGVPVVGLPAGRTQNGLPLGLQFVGRFWHDEKLLSWAEMLIEHL